MQYRKLGHTGLDVSPICIGCMGFGDPSRGYPAWSLDEEASQSLIRHSIEAGINFFDTANVLHGSSEEIVGRSLKKFTNRDSVVIATKVAPPTPPFGALCDHHFNEREIADELLDNRLRSIRGRCGATKEGSP